MSYQTDVVNATVNFESFLENKQGVDAEAGNIANDLLTNQINESTTVLNVDAAIVQEASTAGNTGGWTTSDSGNFNLANSVYQNDSTISQTGQNNANTAVQQLQSQVSQDGTNLSNAVSIANILVQIGTYMVGILGQGYTVS